MQASARQWSAWGGLTISVVRRRMQAGRLGVAVVQGNGAVVVIADDVPQPLVAAAMRHIVDGHAAQRSGVAACRAPWCPAAGEWRPTMPASMAAGD